MDYIRASRVFLVKESCLVWWHRLISGKTWTWWLLGGLRQETHKFEACLGNLVRPRAKVKSQKGGEKVLSQ